MFLFKLNDSNETSVTDSTHIQSMRVWDSHGLSIIIIDCLNQMHNVQLVM